MGVSDPRRSIDLILRDWGHNIILQRRVNEYTSDDPEYQDYLELHTVRHTHGGSGALPGVQMEAPEGQLHGHDMVYYMRYDADPAPGDRIYENIDIYPNNLTTFIVDKTIPVRGRGGRIEYWIIGASQETPN